MTKEVKKTRNLKVIVRKGYGGYEMLAGHNRMNAAQIAGMKEVPASLYSFHSEE